MNSEVFEALNLLEKERGIPVDFMLDKIKKAILTACKNSYGNEDALINMDAARGNFEVFLRKIVVEQVEDPGKEISLAQAREIDPSAGMEDKVNVALNTKEFGRIAAQTARNIIRQGIRDGERGQMMQEFQSKNQELVSALVERVDPRSGAATLKIGKAEAVLPKSEQVGDEQLREGDHIKVYVVDVKETEKGPRAMISRTHPDLVKRLFETEVPEIYDGVVEIKAVSREAGSRTKLAVQSHNADVDAVGACIGARGARVSNIVNELGGEKIDIVEYSEDPAQFIASALSPADVVSVQVAEDGSRVCRVTVPDSQLSLAIGNKGQNARLAAKLTGWKIDIKPESGFFGEEPAAAEKAEVIEEE
ncbi:MAG: transcription termination factor NusA [Clostridium sp.]|uniref:transcription termination factor NusA n=1 Tax=Clostridium sp. TaxID=1506 RepID=UPI00290C938B|nr:transcription termination factor NusA [Clostridium sp.]MDU7338957.1 transcription termination factor NusA [Clostridium sp.]